MKRIYTSLFAALIIGAIAWPTAAQKLDVGVQSAIVYQALDHESDDDSFDKIAPGFQNAVGNLTFGAEVFPGGKVNVDVFISSKHHGETYGYQGFFQMSKTPEWMQLGRVGNFYDNHVDVRAGQMTLNFGDGDLYRSINGDVYNNELVGNPVVNPALTALGMEATVSQPGLGGLMLGFSNGTTSGDISEGKGLGLHAKAFVTPVQEKVRLAASLYRVDHSANGTGYPGGGTKSYLFSQGDRAGSRYDIWNGPDGGQIFFGKEQDVFTAQLDARFDFKPLLVYGAVGYYKDSDCNGTVDGLDNGNPVDKWNYFMATAKWSLTDWLYVAGRYSAAMTDDVHVASNPTAAVDGKVNRIQVGGGFYLNPGVLVKVEYVNQTTDGFPTGYINNRTNLGLNPSFSGLVVETAVRL